MKNISEECTLGVWFLEHYNYFNNKLSLKYVTVEALHFADTIENSGHILDEALSGRNPHKILVSMLDRGLGSSTKLCLTAV